VKLYSFFNSSTSYRVRVALALKGIAYEYVPVNIRTLEHHAPDYVAMNTSANVPLLVDGDLVLGQSLAIVDYLDGIEPTPRLIPQDLSRRSRVLEFASMIGCDIHPVNNLRVLRYLEEKLGQNAAQKSAWYAHWIDEGFAAGERLLARHGGGPFAFGDAPTIADCWLVPQVANAARMNYPIGKFPRIEAVYRHCASQQAFQAAAPDRQPDFVG
jgi:maleylacetoacetate isomerase